MTETTRKTSAISTIDRLAAAMFSRANTRLGRACARLEAERRRRARRAANRAAKLRGRVGYPAVAADVRTSRDYSCGLAATIVCVLTALTLLTSIPGCAATTDASGPAADATHETRNETPGEVRSRRVELRIRPMGDDATPGPGDRSRGGEGPAGVHSPGSAGSTPAPATSAADPVSLRSWIVLAAIGQASTGADNPPQTPADLDALLAAAVSAAREKGVEIDVVWDEYEQRDSAADTSSSSFAETPASLRTSSAEAALGFTTKLRRFPLPWGGDATGGGFGFEAKLLGGRGVNVLHVVGAAVMVLAVIPLLRTPRRWTTAATFLGTGIAIVFTGTLVDEYPWITLLAGLLVLGLLGYGAYEAWRRGRLTTTLDSITPAVEKAPNEFVIKRAIGENAGRMLAAVKAETTASKARTGAG